MDRIIVYPGSIPLDTDLLNTNRNTMIALGALTAATIGGGPIIDGLVVVPSAAGGLAVDVGPGSLIVTAALDQTAYGSLPADTTDSVVQTGINIARTTVSLSAPTAAGTATTFLIQASFQELDIDPVVLSYYNSANPSQPFLGANNNGLAQPTIRSQRVALQAKAGLTAPAGSSATPAPDPGWVGVAAVTVANGQTTISSANIAAYVPTAVLGYKLNTLRPGTVVRTVYTSSGTFTVPQNISRLKVTVIGGGGAGGTHATLPSGGGGGGGMATGWFYGVVPGTPIPVTVGAGGVAPPITSPGNGGNGGSSSFGTYLTATGGQGGYGGTANIVMAGGPGGTGYGGEVQAGGSCGTDAIPIAARGGDGGGPGNGRGTSGQVQGSSGTAPGAGGGGSGASAPSGGGVGAQGGSGAPGIVIVEY